MVYFFKIQNNVTAITGMIPQNAKIHEIFYLHG